MKRRVIVRTGFNSPQFSAQAGSELRGYATRSGWVVWPRYRDYMRVTVPLSYIELKPTKRNEKDKHERESTAENRE